MNIDIKLHKYDLPEHLDLGNIIAVDGEFMGLNVSRDPLCLIQISSGKLDAHIVQLDRSTYNAPNLNKLLSDEKVTKIFKLQTILFPFNLRGPNLQIKSISSIFSFKL